MPEHPTRDRKKPTTSSLIYFPGKRPSQTPQYWKQKHCHTRYPPLRPTPVSPVPRVLCDEKKKNEKLNEKETPRLLND